MPTKKYGPSSTTNVILLSRCLFAARQFFGKHPPIPHEREEHPYELEDHGTERLCLLERTITSLLLVFVVCLEKELLCTSLSTMKKRHFRKSQRPFFEMIFRPTRDPESFSFGS